VEAHAEHAHHHHHEHHHDEVEVNPATWSDPKRYAWLLGIIVPLAPFIGWALVELTGFGGFWFIGPVLVFVAFPILDMVVGLDSSNPPDSVLKFLEQDRYYRWCTYVFIPIQYAGLVLACWKWGSGNLSIVESIGLALTMGVVGGIAINTAHELGHKREAAEKWLSRVALAQTGYGHFFREIGRAYPGIDLALLPIGAYAPRWMLSPVHTDPEEAVQAFLDVGAAAMAPMHWATFLLSSEPPLEPLLRVRAAWSAAQLPRSGLWDLPVGGSRVLAH